MDSNAIFDIGIKSVILLWSMVACLMVHQKHLVKRLLRDKKEQELHWLDWSFLKNLTRISMSLFFLSIFIIVAMIIKVLFFLKI